MLERAAVTKVPLVGPTVSAKRFINSVKEVGWKRPKTKQNETKRTDQGATLPQRRGAAIS